MSEKIKEAEDETIQQQKQIERLKNEIAKMVAEENGQLVDLKMQLKEESLAPRKSEKYQ